MRRTGELQRCVGTAAAGRFPESEVWRHFGHASAAGRVQLYQIQLTLQGFKGSVSSGVMVDVYDPARFSVSDWVAVNTNVPMLSDFRLDGRGANLVATTAGFYTRTMDTFVSSDGGQTWNLMGIAGPGIYTKNFATTSDGASIYYSSGVAGIVMPGQIWKFNGVGWSQRMGMAFTARQRHALAKFNGSLYAIGGITADGLYQGDVWRSTDDGANWIKVATPFYGRADVCAVAFQGKLVAIAGSAPGKNVSEVWSSPDGVNWTQQQLDSHSPFFAGVMNSAQCAVNNGRLYFAQDMDVVSTADLQNWDFEPFKLFQMPAPGMVALGGKLYFANGTGTSQRVISRSAP